MSINKAFFEDLMAEAVKEAEKAKSAGEVPIGAVIANQHGIIAGGHNLTESEKSVTKHAEISAIESAGQKLGNWRLNDCILCVTLEPCTMCTGAILLARIGTVVFGTGDSRQGAMGSLYDLSDDERFGKPPRVIRGVMEDECRELLQGFFADLRKKRD